MIHFQKIHEQMLPESEKWSQNYVRYTKIPPTWGRIREDGVKIMSDISVKSPKEATCSNNTHICDVFEVQLGRHGGDKRGKERSEQQSDKAENHHQNGVTSGRFEVPKVMYFITNALWLYSELCFLPERGACLQKNEEESSKLTRR